MSEDLIRRSDAIKAIASLHILADEEKIFRVYADNPHSMTTDFEGTLIDAINAIKSIPTIEPKRGEWVSQNPYWHTAICSNCNKVTMFEEWDGEVIKYDFCPNCGARMFVKDINVPNKKGTDDEC